MDNYNMKKVLGKGSFGAAWLVQRRSDGSNFVAKEVRLAGMRPHERESAKNEISMLRSLSHPNITKYVDHVEAKGNLYIVMEYANGGDLYTKIKSRRGVRMAEKEVLHFFSQLCLALLHMHQKRILHRDIKTQNVFLTQDGVVKLGDFGISTVLRNTYEQKKTVCGTPYYFSPELCTGKPYNNKSDVWALGCILYELTTLQHAFDGTTMKGLTQKILKGSYPPIHQSYSPDLAKLIAWMLKIDPIKRPNIQQIVELEYMQSTLYGLKQAVEVAQVDKKSPFVGEQERLRGQMEARRRAEEEKAMQAQREERDRKVGAEVEAIKKRRAEEYQKVLRAQEREHEVKMARIREQQEKQEKEDRVKAQNKKDLEERVKAQRQVQRERNAKAAEVQKKREEEWERNMKQAEEEHKRRQQLQEENQRVQEDRRRLREQEKAQKEQHDAQSAARLYREMRREAQANRERAAQYEQAHHYGDAPANNSPPPPPPQYQQQQQYQQTPIQRRSPQQQRNSPPQQHPTEEHAGQAPTPNRRPVAAAEAMTDEDRKNAFWVMRREAAANKRRLMGLPAEEEEADNNNVNNNNSPYQQQQQQQPVRRESPPPVRSPPPPPQMEDDDDDDSDNDGDAGLHRFLNGEAAQEEEGHANGQEQQQPHGGNGGGTGQQDYAGISEAVANALGSIHNNQHNGQQNAGNNSSAADFDFDDEEGGAATAPDPMRIVLDGKTLMLQNCGAGDPVMQRIEALRVYLEQSLGDDLFIAVYRKMDDDDDVNDDGEEVYKMLPKKQHKYIPLITQLMVCEEYFNRM